jgi:cytochrome P450
VREFTMQSGNLLEDPFNTYDQTGSVPPFWTENPGDIDGYWVVTRYADMRAVLRDSESFSSVNASIPHMPMEHPMLPTETDPPTVNKYRGILLPCMTPDKIDPMEMRMREVSSGLIGSFQGRGWCDVVEDFARIYPISIFVDFFGLPPGRSEEFREHAHTFLHEVPKRREEWAAIRAIVYEQLALKRTQPQDDLLSSIANGNVDGELIDLQDATNLASTVFLGGLDTLPSNFAWSISFLANHPEARRRIVDDPSVIPDAVEEFLRYFSVANPVRRAIRDVEVGGSLIRENDRVFVAISIGDRDPGEFGDAESVRFDRGTNRHLAFGAGPHRCLGSHLARHELRVALQEWHAQIPDYRPADNAQLSYHGGVLAMDALPITWDI